MKYWDEFVLLALLGALALVVAVAAYQTSNHVKYRFDYAVTNNSNGLLEDVVITRCVTINPKQQTLDDAKAAFVKHQTARGVLSVTPNCR